MMQGRLARALGVVALAALAASPSDLSTALSAQAQAQPPAAKPGAKPATLAVTVNYTGKGTVDAKTEILVFLFAEPDPGQNPPLAFQPITKNGGTATFTGVTQDPVYVVAAYDEKANYDGNSEPPVGTPVGRYDKDGKLVPVSAAKTPKIKFSFSDATRWKQ
jgi:hypothetical protein